jgi:hypothetical protein
LFENLKQCCEEKQRGPHGQFNMNKIEFSPVPHKLPQVTSPKRNKLVPELANEKKTNDYYNFLL